MPTSGTARLMALMARHTKLSRLTASLPTSAPARLMPFRARHTMLSGLPASLPPSSRRFGSVYGNSARQGIASAAARSASRTASSTDSRSTLGMEATGTRVFTPSTRNSGQIRSYVLSSCSRTRRRDHSALRLRRGRLERARPGLRSIFGLTGGGRASIARPYLWAIALLPDEKAHLYPLRALLVNGAALRATLRLAISVALIRSRVHVRRHKPRLAAK